MKFLGVALLLAALLMVVAISCRKRPDSKPPDVDYYTCTMHPSVRKQNPEDKCPICSMDLVPVKKKGALTNHSHSETGTSNGIVLAPEITSQKPEEAQERPTEFTIANQRQQQIGVTYASVEKRNLRLSIRTVGTVAYNKERRWDYVVRVDGYIQKLFVFSPGEQVEKDAPILNLYSPELVTTQNELIRHFIALDDARQSSNKTAIVSAERLIESTKQRLRQWNISESEITEFQETRQPREYVTLYSPFRGVVRTLDVDQGRKVTSGDRLVEIVDLSSVWVWAQFYQDDLPLLKKGSPVTITSSSYPGEKFNGTISIADPFINETTRTGRMRIDVTNGELKLHPDAYVDVELNIEVGEGIAVPASAILPTGKHNIAFVDKGEGKLEPRFVELGRKYGDFYEAKSGLEEGDRIVSSGNFLIDAEARVQGALKSW